MPDISTIAHHYFSLDSLRIATVYFLFMFLLSPDFWEIRKTEKKGKGVFAKKDIIPGTIIGDYLGKLIHKDEEDTYEKKFGFYAMYYHERASIFPDPKQPGIHLINHSCAPNCFMYTYQGHTLYFALRYIFAGEELTVSYLVSPLDEDCRPCTHACHCGSEFCTNTMHMTTAYYDLWTAYDGTHMEGVKLPRVTYGESLTTLPSYPKQIPDNDVYPLFGTTQLSPYPVPDTKIPDEQALRAQIRQTGKSLQFPHIGITVLGIAQHHLFCKNS